MSQGGNRFQMPEMVTVLILRAVSFAGRAFCITLCFEIFILVHPLYYYMRNFSNLIGVVEQWYFSLI